MMYCFVAKEQPFANVFRKKNKSHDVDADTLAIRIYKEVTIALGRVWAISCGVN